MKKFLLFLIVFSSGLSLYTPAQILNPGFENWTAGDPDDWFASNVPSIGLIPVTQTTDKHGGSFALRGDVVNFMGVPMPPAIQSGEDATGFPVNWQCLTLELYYKFTSVEGDRFSVDVGLTKAGNPIAQGAVALTETVTSYTHLVVPLEYTVNEVPDMAVILITITGPVAGNDYHIGSVMYVDDLSFGTGLGMDDDAAPGLAGKCYPNPASDFINFRLHAKIAGVHLYDALGKEIKYVACGAADNADRLIRIPVRDLPDGLYFYSLEGNNSRDGGIFSIRR